MIDSKCQINSMSYVPKSYIPRTGHEYASKPQEVTLDDIPIYTWGRNDKATRDLVLFAHSNPSNSAYPLVDPNLSFPDPGPPSLGLVFDNGHGLNNRYRTSTMPYTTRILN